MRTRPLALTLMIIVAWWTKDDSHKTLTAARGVAPYSAEHREGMAADTGTGMFDDESNVRVPKVTDHGTGTATTMSLVDRVRFLELKVSAR